MLSKLLTVVLLVSLTGACKKEYKKEENAQIDIAGALNKGKADIVINALAPRLKDDNSPLSARERYYLASAYSQKANVDVYSLYSVMEIELFHKEALNWSDLSKEKNPYLKFMKGQEGLDAEKRQKIREEKWEKYLPKLKEKYGVKPKKTLEEMKASPNCYCDDLTQEEYNKIDSLLGALSEKIIKMNPTFDEFDNLWYNEVDGNEELAELRQAGGFWELSEHYSSNIYLSLRRENYLNPEKSTQPFGNVAWEMLYMNILWNTYEAIPLLKKLPVLSTEQQEYLTTALEVYLPLLDDKKFKEVSLKNVMLLSGVSLLSVYSSSFKLEEVNSMQDLFCSFDPNTVLDNYGLIRERVMFMQRTYKQIGSHDENYKKYKAYIDSMDEKLPKELTPEQKANFIDGFDKFNVDSCFNG